MLSFVLISLPIIYAILLTFWEMREDKKLTFSGKLEKITSGPFKGKFLMVPHDLHELEHEVLSEPISVIIHRINNVTLHPPLASVSLTDRTIDYIDDQLDPICICYLKDKSTIRNKSGGHRVSEHALVAKRLKEDDERLLAAQTVLDREKKIRDDAHVSINYAQGCSCYLCMKHETLQRVDNYTCMAYDR